MNQNRTFNQAQNPFNVNLSNYKSQLQNKNGQQQQNKTNQGCAVAIIIFIVMLFFIRIVTNLSAHSDCRDVIGSTASVTAVYEEQAHFNE